MLTPGQFARPIELLFLRVVMIPSYIKPTSFGTDGTDRHTKNGNISITRHTEKINICDGTEIHQVIAFVKPFVELSRRKK